MTPEQARQLISVEDGFTQRELKASFRRASFLCHPDKGGSQEDFQRLQEAYGELQGLVSGDGVEEENATLANGTPDQKAMAQAALDRWWWPTVMMFGPPDAESVHGDQSTRWGIKRFGNDELRQKFIDATVPQAELLGLTIPDPDLRLDDETGHYVHGPIDWGHFWDVVKGDGPCNRERLGTRVDAHENGAWVREAATAYAEKQAARAAEVAA